MRTYTVETRVYSHVAAHTAADAIRIAAGACLSSLDSTAPVATPSDSGAPADVPDIAPALPDEKGDALSTREQTVLRHLIAGTPNKTIARELGTSESTIKVHARAIYRKIGVSNRTQAAIWAVKNAQFDGEKGSP